METQDFGWAVRMLKQGKRVARSGWNGKGQHLLLVQQAEFKAKDAQGYETSAASPGGVQPFIAIRTVHGALAPWVASPTDALAEDWSEA